MSLPNATESVNLPAKNLLIPPALNTREDFVNLYRYIYKSRFDTTVNIVESLEQRLNLAVSYDSALREYATGVLKLSREYYNSAQLSLQAARALDVNSVDEALIPVLEEIYTSLTNLPDIIYSGTVFVPPDERGGLAVKNREDGVSTFEHQLTQQRLLSISQLLSIHNYDYTVTQGSVSDTIIRRTPYCSVHIPLANRVILVCDEIGNRTFVFDTVKLEELGIGIEQLTQYTKEELKKLIQERLANQTNIGTHLVYSKTYLNTLYKLITGESAMTVTTIEKVKKQNADTKNKIAQLPLADSDGVCRDGGFEYVSASWLSAKYGLNSRSIVRYFSIYIAKDIRYINHNATIYNAYKLNEILVDEQFQRLQKILRADSDGVCRDGGFEYVSAGWLYKQFGIDPTNLERKFGHYIADTFEFLNKHLVTLSYNLTSLLEDKEFQNYLKMPKADDSDVYEKDGVKYASARYVAKKFEISSNGLKKNFGQYIVESIEFIVKHQHIRNPYNLTSLLSDYQFQKWLAYPKTDEDGVCRIDGVEYVSAGWIYSKFCLGSLTLKKYFDSYIAKDLVILASGNLVTQVYNLTRLKVGIEFQNYINQLKTDEDGVCRIDGVEYVSAGWLQVKYSIDAKSLKKKFNKHCVEGVEFKTNTKIVKEAYDLKRLLDDPSFAKYIKLRELKESKL